MDSDEKTAEIEFPVKGIAVDAPLTEQQGGTTPLGVNVRYHESQTQRGRGGSRSGLSKYFDAQASGTNKIQCMDSVVRTDGNALAWHFEGEDFAFTGLYLGLDLSGIAGDSQPTGGGGGYQPSASFQTRRNSVRLKLEASHTTRDISQSVIITGTVTNETGAPVGLKNVVLHTSPGGRGGDRDGATSSLIDGTAQITVRNDRAETVKYLGTVENVLGRPETRSRNAVEVEWTEQAITDAGSSGFSGDPFQTTKSVVAGDLLVITAFTSVQNQSGQTVSITDSQGNAWVQVGDYATRQFLAGGVTPTEYRMSMWYAVANATGSMTATMLFGFAGGVQEAIMMEFSKGSAFSSPADGNSTNSGAFSGTVSTGSVGVSESGEVVVAAFGSAFALDLTTPSGFSYVGSVLSFVYFRLDTSSPVNVTTTGVGSAEAYVAIGASFKRE